MTHIITLNPSALRLIDVFRLRTGAQNRTEGDSVYGLLMVMGSLIGDDKAGDRLMVVGEDGPVSKSLSDIAREIAASPSFRAAQNEQAGTAKLSDRQSSELQNAAAYLREATELPLSDGDAFLLATEIVTHFGEKRFYSPTKDTGSSFGYSLWTKAKEHQPCTVLF